MTMTESSPAAGKPHRARPTRAALGLALTAALGATAAGAEPFTLSNPNDSVIGSPFYVKSKQEHTLLDVGRHFSAGVDEMKTANPAVDQWLPGEGTDVLVPHFHVLPNTPRDGIVINLSEKRMYFYKSPTEVETFPVGVAREGFSTPTGTFTIIEKKENPTWTPPESIRKEHAAFGDILPAVVPAGPDNPLGAYAMRLSNPSYLIHGTSKPWGIGMSVSGGCTRLYPEDIARLFPMVPMGATVRIVEQPYKAGWQGDDLYLEVNVGEGDTSAGKPIEPVINAIIGDASGVTVDWDEVRRVKEANEGIPRLVGSRSGVVGLQKVF